MCGEFSELFRPNKAGLEEVAKRILVDFYEDTEVSKNMHFAIFGVPEKPNMKAFVKKGDQFYTQTVEWHEFRKGQYDKIGFSYIHAHNPKITESEKEKWENVSENYGELLSRIKKESQNYSTVLVNSSDDVDISTIMSCFFQIFNRYHTIKK